MGQSIVVTEKPSSYPGVVRFETNRALTGMGHERYYAGQEVWGERPPDEIARQMFARVGVASVHVNANMITVDLEKGHDGDGLLELIENLYRFYPGGAPAPASEAAASEIEADAPEAAVPAADEPTADAESTAEAESTDPAESAEG